MNMRLLPAVILACTLASPLAMAQTTATTPSAAAAPVSAAGQWRASKLVGVNIYNEQNDKIGAIDDVIVDPSGKVDGVVISVGGFLGVGEKDVATQGVSTQFIYRELLKRIVSMFETRQLPIDPRETLEIVAFIEAAKKSGDSGGAPMSVTV